MRPTSSVYAVGARICEVLPVEVRIFEVCTDPQMLDITTVVDFMDLLRLPTVPYVLPPMRSLRLEPLGLADKENTNGAEEEDGAAKLGDALLGLTPR